MLNVPEIEMDLHNSGYKDICTLYIYLFIELAIYPFIYSRDFARLEEQEYRTQRSRQSCK